jgi:hypothetical protein
VTETKKHYGRQITEISEQEGHAKKLEGERFQSEEAAGHCGQEFRREETLISPMAKSKTSATGTGYLGEIMVHKVSRSVGVVESVIEAKAGWPPEITLKLADGSVKKGRLSEFREPSGTERKKAAA